VINPFDKLPLHWQKRVENNSKEKRPGYEALFTDLNADKLMEGLVPVEMEDKWFVYFEDGWLYFHRSWTGALIYWIKLFDMRGNKMETGQDSYSKHKIFHLKHPSRSCFF
jgi:hypothetical protein